MLLIYLRTRTVTVSYYTLEMLDRLVKDNKCDMCNTLNADIARSGCYTLFITFHL
jgi:hypothetical protein